MIRFGTATASLATALALLSGTGRAGGPTSLDEAPAPGADRVHATAAACVLEPAPIMTSSSYTWTTPDAFSDLYWRVPAPCAACGPGQSLDLKTVAFRIRWIGPCTAQAEVSLVGSTGPSGCRVPDPSQVLCGPLAYTIVGTASAGVVHTLAAPAGCCLPPDAFVRIRFIGLDACYPSGPSPGINRTTAACVPCDQYITTTVSWPTVTDWCSVGPSLGSLWVQIGADCCSAVGAEPEEAPRPGTGIAVHGTFSRRVRLAVDLAGAGPRAVEIDAYDVTGRRVGTVLRAALDGGSHLIEWDGRSDAGVPLPPGVYRLRLRDGTAHAVATAALLE